MQQHALEIDESDTPEVRRRSAAVRAISSITPLSRDAREAYHVLSRRGPMTVVDLRVALDVSRTALEGALEQLDGLQLVDLDGDELVAVPHQQVVDNVLLAQAEMLGQVLDRLTVRHQQMRSLIDLRHTLSRDDGDVQAISMARASRSGLYDVPSGAAVEIAAIHPGGQFTEELLERSLARAEASLRDGIRLRVIHQTAALAHPRELQYMQALEELGGRVRLRENLPFRLLLIDDHTAVCSLPAADGVGDAFMLRGQRVVGLLSRVFEATWIDAVPLSAPADLAPPTAVSGGRADSPLRPQQEAILKLLAEGHTDQAIARSLGITTRTVTRRIAEIYETLGVDSRFQAGAAAHRLGLV